MDLLSRLPPEMFDNVLKNLMARDLASMTLVCKSIRPKVTRRLWRFFAIRTKDRSYKLVYPPEALEHVSHLHFRADWEHFQENNINKNRCIHKQRRRNIMTGAEIVNLDPPDSSKDGYTPEDELCREMTADTESDWRFKFLARRAKEILAMIRLGRLQSFAWDLGLCVPDDLLGTDGEITKNQQSIRSLSLITDCYCQCLGRESSRVDFTSALDVVDQAGELSSERWDAVSPEGELSSNAYWQGEAQLLPAQNWSGWVKHMRMRASGRNDRAFSVPM